MGVRGELGCHAGPGAGAAGRAPSLAGARSPLIPLALWLVLSRASRGWGVPLKICACASQTWGSTESSGEEDPLSSKLSSL